MVHGRQPVDLTVLPPTPRTSTGGRDQPGEAGTFMTPRGRSNDHGPGGLDRYPHGGTHRTGEQMDDIDRSQPWQTQYAERLSRSVNQGSPEARRQLIDAWSIAFVPDRELLAEVGSLDVRRCLFTNNGPMINQR